MITNKAVEVKGGKVGSSALVRETRCHRDETHLNAMKYS